MVQNFYKVFKIHVFFHDEKVVTFINNNHQKSCLYEWKNDDKLYKNAKRIIATLQDIFNFNKVIIYQC